MFGWQVRHGLILAVQALAFESSGDTTNLQAVRMARVRCQTFFWRIKPGGLPSQQDVTSGLLTDPGHFTNDRTELLTYGGNVKESRAGEAALRSITARSFRRPRNV